MRINWDNSVIPRVNVAIHKTVKRFEHTKKSKTGTVTSDMLCWKMDEGLNIIGKRSLIIREHREKRYNWEEYGFHLSVSDRSLAQVKSEPVMLSVSAVIGGRFTFPPRCLLVSGLYLISSIPILSQKTLRLEIEHCVQIEDLPENKQLQFISSVLERSDKNYCFTLAAERGTFSSKSKYGILQLPLKETQARLFGIVVADNNKGEDLKLGDKKGTTEGKSSQAQKHSGNGSVDQDQEGDEENGNNVKVEHKQKERDYVQYRAFTFYKYISSSECEFILIAVRNLNLQMVFTKTSMSRHCIIKEGDSFLFQFSSDTRDKAISLGIEGQCYDKGNWRILSHLWPCSIKKEAIDELGMKQVDDGYYLDLPNRRVDITMLPADKKKDLIHCVSITGITEEISIAIMVKLNHLQNVKEHTSTVGNEGSSQQSAGKLLCLADDSVLSPSGQNLLAVMNATKGITDWGILALLLGLSLADVDRIELHTQDTRRKHMEFIRNWMDSGTASWAALVTALRDDLVGQGAVANDIAMRYPKT